MEDWICCKDCIYLEEGDCEAEDRDGCYFGLTEGMLSEEAILWV